MVSDRILLAVISLGGTLGVAVVIALWRALRSSDDNAVTTRLDSINQALRDLRDEFRDWQRSHNKLGNRVTRVEGDVSRALKHDEEHYSKLAALDTRVSQLEGQVDGSE